MGRPKSYDRKEALERARDAFWQHGYAALGVRELEKLTGINRFALKTDFGGKEALFLEALDSYYDNALRFFLRPIREGTLDALDAAIEGLVTPFEGSPRIHGCLMVNTSIENAHVANAEIAARTEKHFQSIRDATLANLRRSIDAQLVRPEVDLAACAAFIVGCVIAINTLNRQAHDIQAGGAYAKAARAHIASWRVR